MQFNTSRKAQIECDCLVAASKLDRVALDRIAASVSIASGGLAEPDGSPDAGAPADPGAAWDGADGARHDAHRLDAFDGGEVFSVVLEALACRPLSPHEVADLLRRHVNRGYDILYRAYERSGKDWEATLLALGPSGPDRDAKVTAVAGPVHPIRLDVGREEPDGQTVTWTFNREGGGQTNSNARFAGMPGVGKSQVLLNLLCSLTEQAPEAGFVLLDYKGDLATNQDFVRATGARVIRPGDEPIPVNPFQLPEGANLMLAPRAFAELFRTLAPRIGPVQESLVTRAMERCYARLLRPTVAGGENVIPFPGAPALPSGRTPATGEGRAYPTLSEIADAIAAMYDEEGRAEDTLLATVRDLARYRLFADVSERPIDRAFGVRWVIDLAGLQALRTFVGFVLVEFLHQAARALPDAAYDPAAEVRGVRGVVAVDEAHYYFRHRCQPVLDLLRVGRSKGVPVFLSSQSLEDFKRYTELSEFLPNTFVFRHGMPPDARTMAGALHTDLGEGASAAARTTSLDKFHALAALSGGEAVGTGPYRRLVLKGFWERGKR